MTSTSLPLTDFKKRLKPFVEPVVGQFNLLQSVHLSQTLCCYRA